MEEGTYQVDWNPSPGGPSLKIYSIPPRKTLSDACLLVEYGSSDLSGYRSVDPPPSLNAAPISGTAGSVEELVCVLTRLLQDFAGDYTEPLVHLILIDLSVHEVASTDE